MAQGIQVPIVADVAQAITGVRSLGDEFDKVADSLDTVADESKDTGRELERRFSDAFDSVRRDSRRTGDDIGDNVKRGTDRATDGVNDLAQEAGQSAKEAAASFSGSFDDIADLAQETAAQAFAGFGPIGAAAGIAAAAGLGALWTSINENAEKTEQRISDMFADMQESGLDYVSKQYVIDELTKIYDKAEDAAIGWADLQRAAELTGVSQELVARAFAGDAQAGIEFTEALRRKQEELSDEIASRPRTPGVYAPLPEDHVAVDRIADQWNNVGSQTDSARERTEKWRTAVSQVETATANASGEVQDLATRLNNMTNGAYTANVRIRPDPTELDRELARPRTITVRARIGNSQVV